MRIRLLRLVFVPIMLVGIFVRPGWDTESTIAYLVELVGYLVLLAGLTVRIWCMFYIGGRKSHELIDSGPYSVCRNPLYMGTFLLMIGVGLCFENLLMLLLIAIVVFPAHYAAVLLEEKHMEGIFGDEYRAYKKRVPRFRPRVSGYKSPEVVCVPVRIILRVAAYTLMTLMLPELEDLLELLHAHKVIPVLWYFPG